MMVSSELRWAANSAGAQQFFAASGAVERIEIARRPGSAATEQAGISLPQQVLQCSLSSSSAAAAAPPPHAHVDAGAPAPRAAVVEARPAAAHVAQPRDHFDASDTKTWQQAYYVNDTFFVPGSSAPVFLCVGGEGPPLDGSVVVASVHCNVAVEWLPATGALMLAVEHRYYGCHNASACPYSAADPQPLKWLSSRQALADLASFHAHATAAFGLTEKNKWVSWGGSYPGCSPGGFTCRTSCTRRWRRGARHREARHAGVQ